GLGLSVLAGKQRWKTGKRIVPARIRHTGRPYQPVRSQTVAKEPAAGQGGSSKVTWTRCHLASHSRRRGAVQLPGSSMSRLIAGTMPCMLLFAPWCCLFTIHAADPETAPRKDRYGDPLPKHALFRLGTARSPLSRPAVLALSPDGKTLVANA